MDGFWCICSNIVDQLNWIHPSLSYFTSSLKIKIPIHIPQLCNFELNQENHWKDEGRLKTLTLP
jgi:hypothetical protein